MNKWLLVFLMVSVFGGSSVLAKDLSAKLFFPGDKVWEGVLKGREDGDYLIFTKPGQRRPVFIGGDTLDSIEFEIQLDQEALNLMVEKKDYAGACDMLNKLLAPYVQYEDIKSNLTEYNMMLLKLYNWQEKHEDVLRIAEKLLKFDGDQEIYRNVQVYKALALIGMKNADDAMAIVEQVREENKEAGRPEESALMLYLEAKVLEIREEYGDAMQKAARAVALYCQEVDWMPAAELLCAQLYNKLNLFDSSIAAINQVMSLYESSPEYALAEKLLVRVKQRQTEMIEQKAQEQQVQPQSM